MPSSPKRWPSEPRGTTTSSVRSSTSIGFHMAFSDPDSGPPGTSPATANLPGVTTWPPSAPSSTSSQTR